MSQILHISTSDIIQILKQSAQIPDVVEAIASQKIIQAAAQEAEIIVTPDDIQQEADDLRLDKNLVKAQDTILWLEKNHLSVEEFEELIYNKVLAKKLAEHLFAGQIDRLFYQNQLDYVTAITYEVMLDDRDLALELFYAAEEEEITFPEIARSYIKDPELRCVYGYQGKRHRKDFRPEIAAPVFAATPPQILKPIVSTKGVHLIWVEDIFQPLLDEELRQTLIKELFSNWLKQQIKLMEIVTELDTDSVQSQKELLKRV